MIRSIQTLFLLSSALSIRSALTMELNTNASRTPASSQGDDAVKRFLDLIGSHASQDGITWPNTAREVQRLHQKVNNINELNYPDGENLLTRVAGDDPQGSYSIYMAELLLNLGMNGKKQNKKGETAYELARTVRMKELLTSQRMVIILFRGVTL